MCDQWFNTCFDVAVMKWKYKSVIKDIECEQNSSADSDQSSGISLPLNMLSPGAASFCIVAGDGEREEGGN